MPSDSASDPLSVLTPVRAGGKQPVRRGGEDARGAARANHSAVRLSDSQSHHLWVTACPCFAHLLLAQEVADFETCMDSDGVKAQLEQQLALEREACSTELGLRQKAEVEMWMAQTHDLP